MASLITPIGVLSFPHLFEPRPPAPGAEPRYSAVLIFDEKAQQTPEWQALREAVKEAAVEKWGAKLPKGLRWPFRDGAEKEGYAGYTAGSKFISIWSKQKPGLVDPNTNDILVPGDVWAGQLARASLNPFAYDNVNRGVGLGMNNLQICKMDMPRLDGRKAAAEEFGAVNGADEDEGGGAGASDDLPF